MRNGPSRRDFFVGSFFTMKIVQKLKKHNVGNIAILQWRKCENQCVFSKPGLSGNESKTQNCHFGILGGSFWMRNAKAEQQKPVWGGLPRQAALETSVWKQVFKDELFLESRVLGIFRWFLGNCDGQCIQEVRFNRTLSRSFWDKCLAKSLRDKWLSELPEKQAAWETKVHHFHLLYPSQKPSIKTSFVTNVGFRKFSGFSTNEVSSACLTCRITLTFLANEVSDGFAGRAKTACWDPSVVRKFLSFKCLIYLLL